MCKEEICFGTLSSYKCRVRYAKPRLTQVLQLNVKPLLCSYWYLIQDVSLLGFLLLHTQPLLVSISSLWSVELHFRAINRSTSLKEMAPWRVRHQQHFPRCSRGPFRYTGGISSQSRTHGGSAASTLTAEEKHAAKIIRWSMDCEEQRGQVIPRIGSFPARGNERTCWKSCVCVSVGALADVEVCGRVL